MGTIRGVQPGSPCTGTWLYPEACCGVQMGDVSLRPLWPKCVTEVTPRLNTTSHGLTESSFPRNMMEKRAQTDSAGPDP